MCGCALVDESFAAAGCHTASPREDFNYQGNTYSKMQ